MESLTNLIKCTKRKKEIEHNQLKPQRYYKTKQTRNYLIDSLGLKVWSKSLNVWREQVLTKLSIKSRHQINKNRALQIPPTVQKLFHIHQIPHFPFFNYHFHEIILKALASIFHLLLLLPRRPRCDLPSPNHRRWKQQLFSTLIIWAYAFTWSQMISYSFHLPYSS